MNILIRKGKLQYHVVWNNVIEDYEESFYIPDTALVLSNKSSLAKSKEKTFKGAAVKTMGGKVYRSIGGFTKGLILSPTSIRKIATTQSCVCNEYHHDTHDIPKIPDSSAVSRVIGAVGSGLLIFPGYIFLIGMGGLPGAIIAGTHLTTNVASGLYEWFRYEKNKLERKEKDGY